MANYGADTKPDTQLAQVSTAPSTSIHGVFIAELEGTIA